MSADNPAIDSAADGIDHINVYSRGATELGRFLSNFAYAPMDTEDGEFASIEGYWYWLGSDAAVDNRDRLRTLSGYAAKQAGRDLKAADWQDGDIFRRKIMGAIEAKVRKYTRMKNTFARSRLPLCHYYVYGGKNGSAGKVVEPREGRWILAFLEDLRERLKEENELDV